MIDISELKKEMYDVVGALYEVHKNMGPGLNEAVYQEALEMELKRREVPFERELTFHPIYKGTQMSTTYRLDFLCKKSIIVECKSVSELNANNVAQLFNYMRLLKLPIGIIVNFSPKCVDIQRYFYDKEEEEVINVYGNPVY